MSEAILGGSPCDRDGFRERFLAEHQGIIDDVNTLKSNCEDAVKESEEFAKDGVSLKAKCSGRDVNVRALTKRIRVFQGMKDAVEKCDWASDVATQIQKEGNAGAVQAALRYIYENAPEVDDKARNAMKLDWDALDVLKRSKAETPELEPDLSACVVAMACSSATECCPGPKRAAASLASVLSCSGVSALDRFRTSRASQSSFIALRALSSTSGAFS